jgi:hypothetical protein
MGRQNTTHTLCYRAISPKEFMHLKMKIFNGTQTPKARKMKIKEEKNDATAGLCYNLRNKTLRLF